MVFKCLQRNQPNGFPSSIASTNHIFEVGAEDEGVTIGICQVIGGGGGPIDVDTVRVRNGEQSGSPFEADG